MANEKYALLDTDFISKLHITRKDDKNRMIERIMELPGFCFCVHEQITIEIERHNSTASVWLAEHIENGCIYKFSDEKLLALLKCQFGILGYHLYLNMLQNSCEIFSKGFYKKYYSVLDAMLNDTVSEAVEESFLQKLSECDETVGIDNNLGEIKTYTMSQILEKAGIGKIYVFCSDDRKARAGIAANTPMNCVSAISAFYLTRKYLDMEKEEAKLYFDSWMYLHRERQTEFKLYNNKPGKQLIKMDGYKILDGIYNDTLGLYKDGYLKQKML